MMVNDTIELYQTDTHMISFLNDTATTQIYTLSLHDALPIYDGARRRPPKKTRQARKALGAFQVLESRSVRDRKSTRLNSSHSQISYAVFCLKKKRRPAARAPHHRARGQ